jgi:uncharacterized phage protein gp47/JayE
VTDYIAPDDVLRIEPSALAQLAYVYLGAQWPGWTAENRGDLDVRIIEAVAEMASEQALVAANMTTAVYRGMGPLVGVPALPAAPASASATFTVTDTAGYTIPEGSVVGLRDGEGTLRGFELTADLVIAPLASTGAGAVQALEAGTTSNDLSGTAELVDVPEFVTGATIAVASSGGVDLEDDSVYLARLTETLRLLSPRPILADDFAVLARSVAGVFRAAAIDGYNPGTGTFGNERTVAVAAIDEAGAAVSAGVKTAIDALLQAEREVNFAVVVTDATYTILDVTATVKALPGYDTVDLDARVTSAIVDFLSPATWGVPPGSTLGWSNTTIVRKFELAQAINEVQGVDYIAPGGLLLAVHAGTLLEQDVTLTGAFALPTTVGGTVAVTVTP